MLKLMVFVALCVAVLAQDPPPEPTPPKQPVNRYTRQAPPDMGNMPQAAQDMMGQMGNMGMQGLGNIPDPTKVIAKAQEVIRQAVGRRRRQSEDNKPQS